MPLKYEFIEYPLSLRRLMGFNDVCGLSATGRDMGAMLYGGFFIAKGTVFWATTSACSTAKG